MHAAVQIVIPRESQEMVFEKTHVALAFRFFACQKGLSERIYDNMKIWSVS